MSYSANPRSSMQDLLSKVSRYEALFELAETIKSASDIESVGEALAHRLKYIVDVYAWRYVYFDGDPEETDGPEPTAIVIDGYRGRADVARTVLAALTSFELDLWRDRKTRILSGPSMSDALEQLPEHFRRDDLEQISLNALVENGKTQALYLFCKRRQPFTDLDVKCVSMVCGFFHRKVHMLRERQKLRDLELAYLRQEVMLRQSERLATLGRLSAGMAHELNNPASAATQGAEQLRSSIPRLERAQFALGAVGLSSTQHDLIARLEEETEAEERAKKASSLDPIARSDLEQVVEDWLDRNEHRRPLGACPDPRGEGARCRRAGGTDPKLRRLGGSGGDRLLHQQVHGLQPPRRDRSRVPTYLRDRQSPQRIFLYGSGPDSIGRCARGAERHARHAEQQASRRDRRRPRLRRGFTSYSGLRE